MRLHTKNGSLQIHDLKTTKDIPAYTEQFMIYETLDDNPLFMNLCHQLIQRVLLPIVGEFQIDPIDISHRKICKKKFRKWLMGAGISRNDAELLCQLIGRHKGRVSYGDIHRSFRWDPLLLGGLNYVAIIHEILFGKLLK